MSILDKIEDGIKKVSSSMNESHIEHMVSDTDSITKAFLDEAKKFQIDLDNVNSMNYYDVLGIKFTDDQNAIKAEYDKRLPMAIMPESKDELNEAYSVLSDQSKKIVYDTKFLKGTWVLSVTTTNFIHEQILKNYNDARDQDIKQYNQRATMVQEQSQLNAAIEETTNWAKRYKRVTDGMFERFYSLGEKMKHMKSANEELLKKEKEENDISRLKADLQKLNSPIHLYVHVNPILRAIINGVAEDITVPENNLSQSLKNSIKVAYTQQQKIGDDNYGSSPPENNYE